MDNYQGLRIIFVKKVNIEGIINSIMNQPAGHPVFLANSYSLQSNNICWFAKIRM